MNNMNQYIKNVVKRMYQIDVDTASKEQLEAIEEINVSDITMNSEVTTWNFSEFPNLKKIDCSYLFIKDLITTGCTELEYLRWEGVRGNDIHLDLSTNKKLKKVVGGCRMELSNLIFLSTPYLKKYLCLYHKVYVG